MVVVITLLGIALASAVIVGTLGMIGFLVDASTGPRQTDSYGGLFELMGIFLLGFAIIIATPTCLLLTRRPWSRVVFSVVAGLVAVPLVYYVGWPVIYLYMPLLVTIVLVWVPTSKPFFSRTHNVADLQSLEPQGYVDPSWVDYR